MASSHAIKWYRCKNGFPTSATSKSNPLVVIEAWVGAQDKTLAKHAQLYNALGWDVVTFCPATLSIWFPYWAYRNARFLLGVLQQVSWAATVWQSLGQLCRRCGS